MKRVLGSVLFAAVASLVASPLFAQPAYDLLLVGGMVFDGSGNPAVRADVGIRGDEVVAIGRLAGKDGHEAARTIDVTGLHVSPGWVDLHSPRRPLARRRRHGRTEGGQPGRPRGSPRW